MISSEWISIVVSGLASSSPPSRGLRPVIFAKKLPTPFVNRASAPGLATSPSSTLVSPTSAAVSALTPSGARFGFAARFDLLALVGFALAGFALAFALVGLALAFALVAFLAAGF